MSILYCGDTDLSGAASYLAGLMSHWGWDYDYVPSHVPLTREHIEKPHSLFIFSDYPATQANAELQRTIIEQVQAGAGLLMIGGWESFHGCGGNWDGTPIGEALPVMISGEDDRVNCYSPALLSAGKVPVPHPILSELPWTTQPPTVGGWNSVKPRGTPPVLLAVMRFQQAQVDGRRLRASCDEVFPALIASDSGSGRTAAFMSDVAPHWVGGFVDWGDARVTSQAPGAPAIEVGNWYAQFWRQLLSWTGRLS